MIFYATFFLYVGKKYIYTLASLQFFPQCSSNVSVLSLCLKMEFVQQKCPSISAQFLYFQKKIKMVSPAPQGCHDAINDLIFFFLNPEQSRAFFFKDCNTPLMLLMKQQTRILRSLLFPGPYSVIGARKHLFSDTKQSIWKMYWNPHRLQW